MPVDCSASNLVAASSCFCGLSPAQREQVAIYLLCQIANNGGGGGNSCLYCGDTDPVDPPTCSCALAYNNVDSTFWYWDAGAAAWVLFG